MPRCTKTFKLIWQLGFLGFLFTHPPSNNKIGGINYGPRGEAGVPASP